MKVLIEVSGFLISCANPPAIVSNERNRSVRAHQGLRLSEIFIEEERIERVGGTLRHSH